MKGSKKYNESMKIYDKTEVFKPKDAILLLKKMASKNFSETVEIHFNLGIDPKQADQQLRGTLNLPHGTGKEQRIVVVCKEDQVEKAKKAGAVDAGAGDMIEKIQKGWFDFDILITSPEMMGQLGKLGRVLGTKGLMPNIKSGTISKDIEKSVREFKKGKIEYRNDKYGNMHLVLGKVDFDKDKLFENFMSIYDLIIKEKPSKAKGVYIKSMSLATTQSPGLWIETSKNKWGEDE
ncbi:MAG: 50S ribosomal protein L1 [bacterium]